MNHFSWPWGGGGGVQLQTTQKSVLKVALKENDQYSSDEIFCETDYLDLRQLFN